MKKVFRIWKFIEVCKNNQQQYELAIEALKLGWPLHLEGLTLKQIQELDFIISDRWLVEEQ